MVSRGCWRRLALAFNKDNIGVTDIYRVGEHYQTISASEFNSGGTLGQVSGTVGEGSCVSGLEDMESWGVGMSWLWGCIGAGIRYHR